MEAVRVLGGVQEEVAYGPVAVAVPGEEVGDVLPVVVVDRMSQGGAVHPDVDGVTVGGDQIGRGGEGPSEVDVPLPGNGLPLGGSVDRPEGLGGVGVVHGDGLRPQVGGVPLLVHSQGMDLVDPVPVGEKVGQQHDPPPSPTVEGITGIGGLHVGPGSIDEEGVRHIGQTAPLLPVDLHRDDLQIV